MRTPRRSSAACSLRASASSASARRSAGSAFQAGMPDTTRRVTLSTRVTPEVKTAIADAAQANGWSQCREFELRLELSFLWQRWRAGETLTNDETARLRAWIEG